MESTQENTHAVAVERMAVATVAVEGRSSTIDAVAVLRALVLKQHQQLRGNSGGYVMPMRWGNVKSLR